MNSVVKTKIKLSILNGRKSGLAATRLMIGRSLVQILSKTRWKCCQSHARIDSCTQSWFIQQSKKKVAKMGHTKKIGKKTFPSVNFINILRTAQAPILFRQKIQSLTLMREKLRKRKALLYEKCLSKMLMILTLC